MIPTSIRWRLPLSYAAIALLAALALGLVLLTTLRGYYRQQELDYLINNAQAIGSAVTRLLELDQSSTLLQSQLRSFSFLSQTRVRLLDPQSQPLADSGPPQEQRGIVTLARAAEMLDVRHAEGYPATPADVGGLFVRREDDTLFVGTGNMSGEKMGDVWEFRHDGPVVAVSTTPATQIYRDDTLQGLGGVPPSGPVQQVLKPASLDEIGPNSTVKAWGERRADRIAAAVIVFTPDSSAREAEPPPDTVTLVEETTSDRITTGVPVTPLIAIEVPVLPSSNLAASGAYRPATDAYAYSTSVLGTPYGFDLDAAAPSDGHRSDQMTRQPFHDQAGELLGYVELSEGPAYGRQVLQSVTRGWVIAGAAAVLLAAGVGWAISRRISTPLVALTAVTSQMAAGDLTARADVTRQDELGHLGRSFNEMAAQVEATITALRRFVADAAHTLHTPLTALHTNLELLADERDGPRRSQFVTQAQAQLERLETLTASLLNLSRLETAATLEPHQPLELTLLVRDASELYASRAEQADLTFSLDLPAEPLALHGQPTQLRQALGNLLDNAIKFTPPGGAVNVGLRQEGDWITLSVSDTGIGVPADDLPLLFQRFHRAGNAAAYPGNGLGLAIVKAIAVAHGGQVTAASQIRGTRFTLRLPAS